MSEERLKINGTAELSDEELEQEQVIGGLLGVLCSTVEQEIKERKEQERVIVKGRLTADLKQ